MSTNHSNGPEVITAPRSGQDEAMDLASSAGALGIVTVVQEIDEAAVVPLAGGAVQHQVLEGYGYTYRHNWGGRHGEVILSLNSPRLPLITPRSRIFVAVSEGVAGGPDAGKFIGAASFTVRNVAPRANGVDIWVSIAWPFDILLYADYFVVTPPPFAVN
ncbi:MAG TPA: hypothetical protein VN089_18405 [Duganella sp.]|nr:hypothetical protein [Duganella sp.]